MSSIFLNNQVCFDAVNDAEAPPAPRITQEPPVELLSAGRRKLLLGTLLAVLLFLVAIGCFGCKLGAGTTSEQRGDAFRQALLQEKVVKEGVASNQYINPSIYELTAFEASDITEVSEKLVTANITATIENESYITVLTITAKCSNTAPDSAKEPAYEYSFSVVGSKTTPKKGIDFDEAHNLTDCDAILSEDGKSCVVNKEENFSLWFADSTIRSSYTYFFDGKRWGFDELDGIHIASYKNINGSYLAKTGNLTDFVKFEISNLDPEKGTFTISYTIDEPSTPDITYELINGTMEATIDPKPSGQESLEDGYAYYFEAKGTSDRGKGSASCKGYLTISDGSPCIEMIGGTIDYTYTTFYEHKPQNGTGQIATGTMFKQ